MIRGNETFRKVIMLLSIGVLVLSVGFRYSISMSIKSGHLGLLRTYLNAGLDPDTRIIDGKPLMMHAFEWHVKSSQDVVKLLLEYGANINASHEYGSYLSMALTFGQLDAARLLVHKGSTLRYLWMASYNVDDERMILAALPEKFPNHVAYCQDFNSYKAALQAAWPEVYKKVDGACQTAE